MEIRLSLSGNFMSVRPPRRGWGLDGVGDGDDRREELEPVEMVRWVPRPGGCLENMST